MLPYINTMCLVIFHHVGLYFSLIMQVTWYTWVRSIGVKVRELILALHFHLSLRGEGGTWHILIR